MITAETCSATAHIKLTGISLSQQKSKPSDVNCIRGLKHKIYLNITLLIDHIFFPHTFSAAFNIQQVNPGIKATDIDVCLCFL
jgi:hypothetical protein